MGDPFGIGPEVLVRALADEALRRRARWVICGWSRALERAAEASGLDRFWDGPGSRIEIVDDGSGRDIAWPGPGAAGPTEVGGRASFAFVEAAIARARGGASGADRAAAIVTAPISKEAWAMAGHAAFPGHTELLGARFGGARTRMMFVAPMMRVILATAHIPLSRVCGALTVDRVFETIEMGARACARLGVDRARIAVCGVNPHAGEAGLLGDDEERVVTPAIERARRAGLDVRGPLPGDTVFREAAGGAFDLVVAMYHDQGLIAVKTLAFDSAVNVTVGLPVARTSPDHGTAFGIAGRGVADAGSMRSAMELAVRFASGGAGV